MHFSDCEDGVDSIRVMNDSLVIKHEQLNKQTCTGKGGNDFNV